MTLHQAVCAPCSSWFAAPAWPSVTVRLMVLVHLAHLLVAPPARAQPPTPSPRPGGGAGRCRCASRDGQREADPDLPVIWEDTDEGLQWYLRLSAFISHTQRSSDGGGGPAGSPTDMWTGQGRGRLILEQTWSQRWGVCVSKVCDSRTCRRVTLHVACVGPCSWYRHHKCPRQFGGYCVTTPDYQGCKGKGPEKGSDSKFDIVDVNNQAGQEGQEERVVDQVGSNQGAQHMTGLAHSTGSLPTTTRHTLLPGVDLGGQKGPSPRPGLMTKHTGTGEAQAPTTSAGRQTGRRADVASGIRYVWVVSCIVVPTLVFCVGYAIAMHLRRKRLLRAMPSAPRHAPEGASDPFLAAAPPYSVEDLFSCPPGAGLPGLDCPPPSYEVACRDRALTACSEYLPQEPHLSCPAGLSGPSQPPPPYDDTGSDGPGPRRHLRLPSYDSAICLHTSI